MSSNIDVTIYYVLSSRIIAISNFSFRHSKQRFDSGVYAFAFLRIVLSLSTVLRIEMCYFFIARERRFVICKSFHEGTFAQPNVLLLRVIF